MCKSLPPPPFLWLPFLPHIPSDFFIFSFNILQSRLGSSSRVLAIPKIWAALKLLKNFANHNKKQSSQKRTISEKQPCSIMLNTISGGFLGNQYLEDHKVSFKPSPVRCGVRARMLFAIAVCQMLERNAWVKSEQCPLKLALILSKPLSPWYFHSFQHKLSLQLCNYRNCITQNTKLTEWKNKADFPVMFPRFCFAAETHTKYTKGALT